MRSQTENTSARINAARQLPPHRPGVVASISLDLWPVYQDMYSLEVMSLGEIADHEKESGHRKPAGVLYVQTPKQKEHE